MVLEKYLEGRKVPPIPKFSPEEWEQLRQNFREVLFREEYGQPIPAPSELWFEESAPSAQEFASGYGIRYSVTAHTVVCGKPFHFEFHVCLPTTAEAPYPFFVHNDFDPGEPTRFCPIEEIMQRGFAVLRVHYKDVTSDDDDFSSGLAGCVYPNGAENRGLEEPGKIMMWAWANSRLMDYAMTLSCLDHNNGAVIGHSRLGKTALVTGMLDERFRYVISNNAGCSGDAITRGKVGERIRHILVAHRWFCENYKKYSDKEVDLPFDQHMLLATIAPRVLMVGAAYEDTWADPMSEYLCCAAASVAWEQLGETGFVAPDRLPRLGEHFDEGNICFHYRWGVHFLGRTDWNIYMDTIRKHMKRQGGK